MKREILFRAWDKESKTMIYPDKKENHKNANYTLNAWCDSENDRMILMQFTGLTDKNGVKIFEGDILIIDNTKMVVKFDNSCFNVIGINRNYINCLGDEFKAYCDRIIVIGNIYDNDTD